MTSADMSRQAPDYEAEIDQALALVRAEMLRTVARRGSGAALNSSHEGYGVLCEELHKELLDAIHANDYAAQVHEAVQIAAVAARWPIDFAAQQRRDRADAVARGPITSWNVPTIDGGAR